MVISFVVSGLWLDSKWREIDELVRTAGEDTETEDTAALMSTDDKTGEDVGSSESEVEISLFVD